jgi:CubicO group peptidase (beta-lactamase class C family)
VHGFSRCFNLVSPLTLADSGVSISTSILRISGSTLIKEKMINSIGNASAFSFRSLQKISLGLFTAIVLLTVGPATGQQVSAAVPITFRPAFIDVIEREVPAIMKEAKIKGVAVGLISGGKLVYVQGFGVADHAGKVPVTPDTVFLAASIAKPVAAWVALQLAAQGKIDLDQPVADALSPWPLQPGKFDHRLITIRHLLSHTAGTSLGGYQGWTDYKELPTLEQSLAGKTNGRGSVEVVMQPGSKFQYSGGGYTLMQLAIERKLKRKYEVMAAELVFQPLRMSSSSVALTPAVVATAAQGHGDDGSPVPMRYYVEQAPSTLTTTVNDFAKLMLAGMFVADGKDTRPLSKKQLVEIYTPVKATEGSVPGFLGYGLGHFVRKLSDGSTAVGHDGRNQAGFRAMYAMRQENGDGIVFLSNARSGSAMDRLVCLWYESVSDPRQSSQCEK